MFGGSERRITIKGWSGERERIVAQPRPEDFKKEFNEILHKGHIFDNYLGIKPPRRKKAQSEANLIEAVYVEAKRFLNEYFGLDQAHPKEIIGILYCTACAAEPYAIF